MTMLETIKLALRISHNDLDTEIQSNIDTALLELSRVGVDTSSKKQTDKLLIKAVELYCKWQVDFLSKGEQFEKNFCSLRDALSLCSKYGDSDDE